MWFFVCHVKVSIQHSYLDEKMDSKVNLYFGSDSMVTGVEFNDKIKKNSRIMKTFILCIIMIIYMKWRVYLSSKICVSVTYTQYGICYWSATKAKKLLISISKRFVNLCLYIYCHCVEKQSYNFPKTFAWSDLMKNSVFKWHSWNHQKCYVITTRFSK